MSESLSLIRRVRFSPSQWARVEDRAFRCGIQPSVFVRETALGTIPRTRRTAEGQDIAYHLSKIGVNLNQLAHRANAGLPVSQSEISEALERLNQILDEF